MRKERDLPAEAGILFFFGLAGGDFLHSILLASSYRLRTVQIHGDESTTYINMVDSFIENVYNPHSVYISTIFLKGSI